jgi:hypothetical protein
MPTTTLYSPAWSDAPAPARNSYAVRYRRRGTEVQRTTPAGDGWTTFAVADDTEHADYIVKCLSFFAPHETFDLAQSA